MTDNRPFNSHDHDLIAKCKCGCPLVVHSSNGGNHHFECPSCLWSELEDQPSDLLSEAAVEVCGMIGKQPHMRPVGVLSRDILNRSPAWAIVYKCQTFIVCPDDIRGDTIKIDGVDCDVVVVRCHDKEVSMPVSDCVCYPCESSPPFEPRLWPLLSDDMEIEEWRGISFTHAHKDIWAPYWYPAGVRDPNRTHRIIARNGLRPAARGRSNEDGTVTLVWVWEVDPT